MNKPICVKCHIFMRPLKNGIYVLEMADFGPYKLWSADFWHCPLCNHVIVHGYGKNPHATHHEKRMYEIILNGCFNAPLKKRIPIVMAYDGLKGQMNYLGLKPNPTIWLEQYCRRKIKSINKIESLDHEKTG